MNIAVENMLDQESSQRIGSLRFPLIVGVVFIHAYKTTVNMGNNEVIGISQTNIVTDFVRNLISRGFASTAVPLFFLMSGYLFFFGFKFSKETYYIKLKRRTKTLLIPFLFWNIVSLILIVLAKAIPATHVFFFKATSWYWITSYANYDYIGAIFGIGRMPIVYQFWFIRDLMLLILLVPIIHLSNKYAPLPFIFLLLIGWLLNVWPSVTPSIGSTFFFSLGALAGARRKCLFTFDRYGWLVTATYLAVAVTDALFAQATFYPYLQKLELVFGMITALFLTKMIIRSTFLKRALPLLSGASFFVYATHEPLLTIVRKVAYKIIAPQSALLVLALYFSIPILVIAFTVVTYRVLSGISPGIVAVITGGRLYTNGPASTINM